MTWNSQRLSAQCLLYLLLLIYFPLATAVLVRGREEHDVVVTLTNTETTTTCDTTEESTTSATALSSTTLYVLTTTSGSKGDSVSSDIHSSPPSTNAEPSVTTVAATPTTSIITSTSLPPPPPANSQPTSPTMKLDCNGPGPLVEIAESLTLIDRFCETAASQGGQDDGGTRLYHSYVLSLPNDREYTLGIGIDWPRDLAGFKLEKGVCVERLGKIMNDCPRVDLKYQPGSRWYGYYWKAGGLLTEGYVSWWVKPEGAKTPAIPKVPGQGSRG